MAADQQKRWAAKHLGEAPNPAKKAGAKKRRPFSREPRERMAAAQRQR
jgi:hypothetical protein